MANRQKVNVYLFIHYISEVFKKSVTKLPYSHPISIASYKQDNPPWPSPQKHVQPTHASLRNIFATSVQRSSSNQGSHWISLRFSQITITALYIAAVFIVCLFAVTTQLLLLCIKVYEINSQMSLRAVGIWIRNP